MSERLKLESDAYVIAPDPTRDRFWNDIYSAMQPLRELADALDAPLRVGPGPLPGKWPDKDGRYLAGLIDLDTGREWLHRPDQG